MSKLLYILIGLISKVIKKSERQLELRLALKMGLKTGNNCKFIGNIQFGSEPFLIKIGNNVLVTDGVKFITHDGAIQVPLIKDGLNLDQVYGKKSVFGEINIGDNVFIGSNVIILQNTTIEDNSIIAAGSVVKGIYPKNVVIAGVPARIIKTTSEYFEYNKNKIIEVTSHKKRERSIEIREKTKNI